MTHPDKNGHGSLVAHWARRFAQCAGDQVDLATTRVGLATSICVTFFATKKLNRTSAR